jgi:hypothetical protein
VNYRRFGHHDGHLIAQADLLARRHDCTHSNYVDRVTHNAYWACAQTEPQPERVALHSNPNCRSPASISRGATDHGRRTSGACR